MTRIRRSDRDELLGNFSSTLASVWALEDTPVRRGLDEVMVDTILDPRLGPRPASVLLVSLSGASAARRLLRGVGRVTVFDPSGLGFHEQAGTRPGEAGITWAQGPSLFDLPEHEYDVVAVDHLTMVLYPDEVCEFAEAVRHALVPGGHLVLLNGRRPLPGWAYGADSLGACLQIVAGDPVLEHDLGVRRVGVWQF